MITCRKCGKEFPTQMKIDGKKRILKNRKFCLECSPYGSRNTKADDPKAPRITKDRHTKPYGEWAEKEKEEFRARCWWRTKRRKGQLLDLLGNKCSRCGYDKYSGALHFHHKDPKNKSFELSKKEVSHHTMAQLKEEALKCELLCANCHAETEHMENESRYAAFKEKFEHLEAKYRTKHS